MLATGQSREEGSNGGDLQRSVNSGELEVKDVEGGCEGHPDSRLWNPEGKSRRAAGTLPASS